MATIEHRQVLVDFEFEVRKLSQRARWLATMILTLPTTAEEATHCVADPACFRAGLCKYQV
jgi:hypothetical protein